MTEQRRVTLREVGQTLDIEALNVDALNQNIAFVRRLKEVAQIIHSDVKVENDRIRRNYRIQKKYLDKIVHVTMLFYFVVMPFYQQPYWCIVDVSALCPNDSGFENGFLIECSDYKGLTCNGKSDTSDRPFRMETFTKFKIATNYANVLVPLMLTLFVFSYWFQLSWRKPTRSFRIRWYILLTLYAANVADCVASIFRGGTPFITNVSRFMFVLLIFENPRNAFW